MKSIVLVIVLIAAASTTLAAPRPRITSGDKTWQVAVADTYQITADQAITTWGATGLPAGLTVNIITGLISGTPAWGTDSGSPYSVTLSATNGNGTGTKTVTFTVLPPATAFVGFRLNDFLMSAGPNQRLMLQMGADGSTPSNRFNATLEVDASGNGTAWVPYDHFVGINDPTSWVTDAPLPVRDSGNPGGVPPPFSNAQLTQSPPAVYMKADPRATRFGIFQMDTNPTTNSRIVSSLWPSASGTVPNGFGGTVGTTYPGPVEHAPNRFASAAYYPGTFCINPTNGLPDSPRDTAVTTYPDNDGVIRPGDALYPGAASTTGASTPYYATPTSYHPIMLNRPFRNVAELGYAFRDLPWKTLDFFSDKSADAGLLDIFTINDGAQVLDANGNVVGMAPPTKAAGSVNLNTTQAADLQSVLAGTILDEINSTIVNSTGTGDTDAPVLANRIVTATSTTPMQNKSELLTRAGLPTQILPTASNDNQSVKARREVVARTLSSVSQTRVWNLLIDVVAQTGRYKPNAQSLQNDFVVEGETHYWVHVAIDRFTGQVIDKQIEVVTE
jgi:Putative Ig domain